MVKAGVVDDTDWFFAGHLGCNLPSGTIAAGVEKLLFSTKLDVTFRGRSAHAANNPQDGRNTVPGDCTMLIEVRGESDESLGYMEARAQDIIEGVARQSAVRHEIERMGRTIGEPTDDLSRALVTEVARGVSEVNEVVPRWVAGGSDDAADFMRRMHERGKAGCYFVIGSSLAAGHHATRFEFQEQDLAIGVRMYMGLLARASKTDA